MISKRHDINICLENNGLEFIFISRNNTNNGFNSLEQMVKYLIYHK